MSDPSPWLAALRQRRVIAVIRSDNPDLALRLAHLAAEAGIGLIEITWNSAEPGRLIAQLRRDLPQCWIGAGTLLTQADLEDALGWGSQFCFSPHTHPELIRFAQTRSIPLVPGALTPTEILGAWQNGAEVVKVFPIQSVGGPAYLRALQGPLGFIPLIPTGGVTLENTPAFLSAGAIAVGLSGALFPRALVEAQDWRRLGQHLRSFVEDLELEASSSLL
ncbi:MAG: bifunctional 4-hydroxy-2-oxoglutarate aldolase/2-dehydro-3-deoxy-phosphogluconate aldolase [Cyanobacteriota bacterium]|jgi:2-dehydro-3-deoxyphosphogluconate aldolase/(4S)-4-hydroxy-2-oxoglutarate aldolase